jgi:hypothetical protein
VNRENAGGEKRFFAEGTIMAAFKVTESTVTSKGVVIVSYDRAGAILVAFSATEPALSLSKGRGF